MAGEEMRAVQGTMGGLVLAGLVVLGLAGCPAQDGRIPLQYCEDPAAPDPDPVSESLTWYADIAPLAAAKCGSCHVDGGLPPFALQTAEDYRSRTDAVRDSIVSRRMPPWSAEPCCGKTYRHDRSMTPDQIDQFVGWLDQGAPEGDPATAAPLPPPPGELAEVDLELTMDVPYVANPQLGTRDDVRCFLLDLPEGFEGGYITGFDVLPGEVRIVHHVATNIIPANRVGTFEKLDADDPDPGWDCFGGVGAVGGDAAGGWVPGNDALVYPEGYGTALPAGSKVMLNMHYDLSVVDGEPTEDQTTVQYTIAREVEGEMQGIPILHPLWLFDNGMAIEGDFAETSYGFAWDPRWVYGAKDWEVWGVFVHMHELGTSTSVALLQDDADGDGTDDQECLLHIAEWDFAWQANYWFDSPTRLNRGDRVYLECSWRNPFDDIAWQTDEEMCAAVLFATPIDKGAE